MKLRYKKTGQVIDGFITTIQWNNKLRISHCGGEPFRDYNSLAELNEAWEDYKSKEPLIKDEKIRKAVRAWAEAVGTECVEITHSRPYFIRFMSYLADEDELCMCRKIGQLFDEKLYTIAELCGEEL